ncbi:hypothetical protein CKK33_18420 [Mucilaginibacter sp. MD40]|uniref:carboxypeptidase-like regulatory domain-containing protein n=1 Tax=Mucilaginibacter sp. MD40 TaxID=2029590 RepID=UPI000BACB6F2|nr:carboxypeptidase-like regulatory domain-containing protein [Mucilaginibacter sp. MD40]PAW95366.1 hypothetical protein CKK33_18420 [Mucilaginibacter sp. MD40]
MNPAFLNFFLFKTKSSVLFMFSFIIQFSISAQTIRHQIYGQVTGENEVGLSTVTVQLDTLTITTDKNGFFAFDQIQSGSHLIKLSREGYLPQQMTFTVTGMERLHLNFQLKAATRQLTEVIVKGYKAITGMGYLNDVHNGVIYAGKKTEVILLDSLDANTAQNNPRQVLGRIPGANYSETEGGGFPSNGIGFRGLNPTQSV